MKTLTKFSWPGRNFFQKARVLFLSAILCVAGDQQDAAEAAKKIEAFVNGYVKPSYSYNEASAIEVAEEREGDCTEYAVLTAALCRAVGIPARVVTGYTYLHFFNFKWNVFVPHAWTEAFIGEQWIGLDATRSQYFGTIKSFTAGHIALSGTGNKPDMTGINKLSIFNIQNVEQ